MINLPPLLFTVDFITNNGKILLLHRKKAPNKGKWNGVGGHIEPGESPYHSMLREIGEETGIKLESVRFGGILTWEGFEINIGGLYIFSAEVNSWKIKENGEGHLDWHPVQFAFSHPNVVDNIHFFLPPVLAHASPLHFHFMYQDGIIVNRDVTTIPSSIDIHRPFFPEK
jgi:8-oxo-dGTP diphosphatase